MKGEIIRGLSFAEYQAIDALNASLAKTLTPSPRKAKYDRENPKEPSAAMRFGSAFHSRMLERTQFDLEYPSVGPDLSGLSLLVDGKGKPYKKPEASDAGKALVIAATEKWQAENPGAQLLSADDRARIEAMEVNVLSHPDCDWFSGNHWEREVTIVWTRDDGVKCKARMDFANFAAGVFGDLKTTNELEDAAVKASAFNFGYPLSLAWYCDAMRSVGVDEPFACVLWACTVPPHDVGVQVASPKFLAYGKQLAEKAVAVWKATDGLKADVLPGAELSSELDLPYWVRLED